MCGIVVARTGSQVVIARDRLGHRGPDAQTAVRFGPWWFGHTRLAIVDLSRYALQPMVSDTGMTMFNGEIYNYKQIYQALEHKPERENEIHTLDALMHRASDFMRVLDGDFAIARVDRGTGELTLARDFVGVVPLYYEMVDGKLFTVASEKKALAHVGNTYEVRPGEVLTFDSDGKLMKSVVWDPIGMTLREPSLTHLDDLWFQAVEKRYDHSDVPVTVALSGGLDSSLILTTLRWLRNVQVTAITVAMQEDSDEVRNAEKLTEELNIKHKVVLLTENDIQEHWSKIQYHLEDPQLNPIKWRGMVRNYFVAMHTDKKSKVILTGEGADELFCGYPSHAAVGDGMKLEWKSLGTFQSMPVINLDRVNKGGMAWGKEYRVPFLDRDLVLYVMSCRKMLGKELLRRLAGRIGVPDYILKKAKYGEEEDRLGEIYKKMTAA